VSAYRPKTGQPCSCRCGIERDNCPMCEGTGQRIDFAKIRAQAPVSELARLRAENETLRAALVRLVAAPDLWLDEMEDETIKALEQARAALDQSNKGE